MSELIEVMAFNSRVEAEIAQGLLEEKGIESIIRAADLSGLLMGVSLARRGGIKLTVMEEDVKEAQEILAVLKEDHESFL